MDARTVVTILLTAAVTYLTRVGGHLLLRDRAVSPRLRAVVEVALGCALIMVIAPDFVTVRPADVLAPAATVLAATRLPMLPTVAVCVVSAGALRDLLG